ncbi:S-adenosylmethionine:tRNA ribosyltransferase-isomerase [soil metagenome]
MLVDGALAVAPATFARPRAESRLLVWPSTTAAPFADLPNALRRGDLVVVNDSGTLPASLRGVDAEGRAIEARLLSTPDVEGEAHAVLFGDGDYRTRTEDRPAPPPLGRDAALTLGSLHATVIAVLDHPRLVRLRFHERGAILMRALYIEGRPIQYAHVPEPLALWDVQNVYAGPAVSAELPSAGRPITFGVLEALSARGVRVVAITHAAGLSSTGDAALDAMLPLPERYWIDEAAAGAIEETRRRGARVIAVGTSVVRALEGAARSQKRALPRAESAITDLRIDRTHELRVVDAILTGVHAPGESHYELLEAFTASAELDDAFARAGSLGLLSHEFGDAILLWSARARS